MTTDLCVFTSAFTFVGTDFASVGPSADCKPEAFELKNVEIATRVMRHNFMRVTARRKVDFMVTTNATTGCMFSTISLPVGLTIRSKMKRVVGERASLSGSFRALPFVLIRYLFRAT